MLFGDPEEKLVEYTFENEVYASHGGGDIGMVKDFVDSYGKKEMTSDIHVSVQSHEMGFAAEESAQAGGKLVVIE
jgi:hypothetical protein